MDSLTGLETQLAELQAQQREQEEVGDYPAAEKIALLVLEAQEEIRRERSKQISTLQLQQKIDLETRQLEDFESFKGVWEKRTKEKRERDRAVVQETEERCRKELEDLRLQLEATLPLHPKPSAALLSLRETERRAARAKHYQEAQFSKARALELVQLELEQHLQSRNEKIQHEIDLRAKRLDQEMRNLKQRLQREEAELLRSRTQEADALVKRFQNAKSELDTTQGMERNRVQGKHSAAGRNSAHSQVLERLLHTPTKGRSSRATHRSAVY